MRSKTPRPTVAELQAEGVLLVEDGNHGEYRPRSDEFVSEGVAFIRAADMDGGRVLFESAERINGTAMARIRKGIGRPGDVLLSHKGTVGKVSLTSDESPPYVCSPQTTFWRTLDASRLDRHYLYAYLRSPDFRAQLASRKGETDMADYVSLTAQRQLKVALPEISIQREIGTTVGALDARINLLRQTNATLESIAQALFKSWFIDFDPVRAKAEGREPLGMDAATAALFPADFQESALGLIPTGWRIGTVEDLFVLQRGFDLPTSQRTDGPYTVFSASGPHGTHSAPMAQGPGVITGRSGVIGRVFYAHEAYWPLNTALWVKQFKAGTPAYAFQYLKTMDLARLNAGSAVPTLNRNHVHAQPAVIPHGGLVSAYTAVAIPLLERVRVNCEHARALEAVRDALLPRLIAGTLPASKVEVLLEEAAA